MCVLEVSDGDWALLMLGTGDLQGDRSAPDRFLQVFDPCVENWVSATTDVLDESFFIITEPATFTEVNTSYGTYADDLLRLGIVLGE